LPQHLVAEDLANGQIVELARRAWHMRLLTFVISQRRGYDLSPCESRLVELLGDLGASSGKRAGAPSAATRKGRKAAARKQRARL
jgi:hypothetical protein